MTTRDGASIGRGAGTVLAETLANLTDGVRLANPIGVSRIGREWRRVAFAVGDFAQAGAWLQTPGLLDAFALDVTDDQVRIFVPSEAATSFDIIWTVRFAFVDGELMTSEPGFIVADGMDELLDDFNDGIAAGLELHPRTGLVRPGFGALGEFEPN